VDRWQILKNHFLLVALMHSSGNLHTPTIFWWLCYTFVERLSTAMS